MKYRPEVDGLRALAVLAVVIFHFFPKILELGYLGVDIFFVISGYLITANLLNAGTIRYSAYLKVFYERRLKRLFPALFVFLCITSLLLPKFFLNSDLERFQQSLIATQTFWANWYFWRDGGYFGGNDQLKPLLHMWSLAVEEQFYLVYPTVIFLLVAARKRLGLSPNIGIIVATSLSFGAWVYLNSIGGQNPAFFLLPTRAWQFGLGAIISYIHFSNSVSNIIRYPLVPFLSVLIFILGFLYPISQAVNTILVTFAAALFILSKPESKIVTLSLFSNSIATSIGRISYSLFLYHWPIAVLLLYVSVETPSVHLSLIGILLSIVLGWASYKLIEQPFRYDLTFRFTAMIVGMSAVVGLTSTFQAIKEGDNDLASNLAKASGTHFRCAPASYIPFGSSRACIIGSDLKNSPRVALVGNSHAQMYAPLVDLALKEIETEGLFLVPLNGCLPTTTVNISLDCLQKAVGNFEAIVGNKSIKFVLIASTWRNEGLINAEENTFDKDDLRAAFSKLIDAFTAADKRVALFSPIQTPGGDIAVKLPRLLKFQYISEHQALAQLKVPRSPYDSEFNKLNEYFDSVLGSSYIKVYKDLCDKSFCYYGNNNEIFFADNSHLSKNAFTHLSDSKKQIIEFLSKDSPLN